jgi:hypothetical protein
MTSAEFFEHWQKRLTYLRDRAKYYNDYIDLKDFIDEVRDGLKLADKFIVDAELKAHYAKEEAAKDYYGGEYDDKI